MSQRNDGKVSEAIFRAAHERFGKEAFVHRFRDAADLRGLNGGKAVRGFEQPADWLVVFRGRTFLAEVKSTADPTAFRFSLLRRGQGGAAARAVAAEGEYFVFVHRPSLDRWYRIPYDLVMTAVEAGKKSLRWDDLDLHAIWDPARP